MPPIRKAFVRTLLNCTAGASALVAVTALGAPAMVQSPVPAEWPTGRETAHARQAARVGALVAEHGCWTGAAPAGAPSPQHAVVTSVDGRTRLVDADVGYGIWLERREGTLHAFCP